MTWRRRAGSTGARAEDTVGNEDSVGAEDAVDAEDSGGTEDAVAAATAAGFRETVPGVTDAVDLMGSAVDARDSAPIETVGATRRPPVVGGADAGRRAGAVGLTVWVGGLVGRALYHAVVAFNGER